MGLTKTSVEAESKYSKKGCIVDIVEGEIQAIAVEIQKESYFIIFLHFFKPIGDFCP